jgi:ABC-2 type transport system permease protein
MHKTLLVAKREYVETARTRMFWLSAFVPIAIFVGLILVGGVHVRRATSSAAPMAMPQIRRTVAVLDLSGHLFSQLRAGVDRYNSSGPALRIDVREVQSGRQDPEELKKELDREVAQTEVDAYLVFPSGVVAGEAGAELHVRNGFDIGLYGTLRGLVGEVLTPARLREQGVAASAIANVEQSPPLSRIVVASSGGQDREEDRELAVFRHAEAAFFFLFLMFFTIVTSAQALLTALIEERSSRIVEVLLSAVSPFQLMAGKILGLAGIGLTLAAACTAAVLGAAASQGLLAGQSLGGLAYFLPYFLLGFLLIASLYAAVGAACNTLKEAQTMMLPVLLIFMLPMMAWMAILQHPGSWPVVALSVFPPTAPMVMVLRMASGPPVPAGQVIASLGLLALSAPLVMWGAARAFRTGVLMYGKPPKLGELLRWMRQG